LKALLLCVMIGNIKMEKQEAVDKVVAILTEKMEHSRRESQILWRRYNDTMDMARNAEFKSVRDAYGKEADSFALNANYHESDADEIEKMIETLKEMIK
jgi:hypothetical protein